jgi:hypothetical protein
MLSDVEPPQKILLRKSHSAEGEAAIPCLSHMLSAVFISVLLFRKEEKLQVSAFRMPKFISLRKLDRVVGC